MAEIRKPNMDPKKAPMPAQDPNVRNKNFLEVCTRLLSGDRNDRGNPLPALQEPSLCGGLPRQCAHSRLYCQGRRGRLQGRL